MTAFGILLKQTLQNLRGVKLSRARGLSVVYGAVYLITFLFLKFNDRWHSLSIPVMDSEYADLRAITSAVECAGREDYIDAYSSNCDPWGRPFNYPPIWVKLFNRFGLGVDSTATVGLILAILVSVSLSYWCFIAIQSDLSIKKVIILSGFLFSPSIYLLNERANTDAIVLTLITVAFSFYVKNARKISTLIIVFASILKVFPIILLFAISLRDGSYLNRLLAFCGIAISSFYLFPFLPQILSNTPFQKEYSFGFSNLIGDFVPKDIHAQGRLVISLVVFLGAIALLFFTTKNVSIIQRICQGSCACKSQIDFFILMWPMFVLLYTLGTSFNYRIVFLVPIVALLLRFNTSFSYITAGLFMPYIVLAIHFGPTSRLLDLTLLIAIANATIFWLSTLRMGTQGNR